MTDRSFPEPPDDLKALETGACHTFLDRLLRPFPDWVGSLWGKIVGGATGFALGGPLGALIGALAGHAVDVYWLDDDPDDDATQKIAFTVGVIALGAKMAKVDGTVSRAEVNAFKRVFRIPPEEARNVGRLYDQACQDAAGFEPYARQLARLLRDRRPVLEQLLDDLFYIALADGHPTAAEITFLSDVARIFGFSEAEFARIRANNGAVAVEDPYQILGVTPDADDGVIKAAWRTLARSHHPDRLIANGLPAEYIATADRKMAAINAAYNAIKRHRAAARAVA
ncbi:MAG: TerB family tellurite resistance protein [Azospirillaceae bacterium]|nr:TerB family tellurite resistance protein [Azospirillaceae bacterium]